MDLFEDPQPGANAPEFSVSEISGAVKRVIEGEFGRVRVRGEVGRVSRPASGHLYLDLKDARSVLAAVVWKGAARNLAVKPEEGMEVVATGRLTTFPGSSKYQMIIEEIAPAGVGALMAMLEKRRAALAEEGLFDAGRKRPLPFLPEVIGVVTSPSGAVIRDILHRLAERFPRRVLVWPVTVQGERCAPEVAAAIRGFNALAPSGPVPRPDVLIVARGGGSLEDLWGFNEEIVVRAAAESAIPLISAVGHETDTTLIDLAADRRAPTPTAAAEMAVPVRLDLLTQLGGLEERRRAAASRALALRGQRLRDLARGLPRPEALVADRAQRLDGLSLRLPRALTALARDRRLALSQGPAGRFAPVLLARGLEQRRERLARAALGLRPSALRAGFARLGEQVEARAARLRRAGDRALADRRAQAGQLGARLAPRLLARGLERERQRLAGAASGLRAEPLLRRVAGFAERLDARWDRARRAAARVAETRRNALASAGRVLEGLDPRAVLRRGYAIVRNEAGDVLGRAAAARKAQGFEIEFADGRVAAHPEKPAPRARRKPPEQGSLF